MILVAYIGRTQHLYAVPEYMELDDCIDFISEKFSLGPGESFNLELFG